MASSPCSEHHGFIEKMSAALGARAPSRINNPKEEKATPRLPSVSAAQRMLLASENRRFINFLRKANTQEHS